MSTLQKDFDGIMATEYLWDEHTESLHVNRTQDVEPVLDRVKAMRNSGFDGFNAERDMCAVAELPVAILEQWFAEGVDFLNPDHEAEVMKRLRDPALSGFRLDTKSAHGGIIIKGTR